MEQNTLLNTEVSRRYSKALFKVASKDNSEQVIYDEVSNLLVLFKSNDIFAKLLATIPKNIPIAKKKYPNNGFILIITKQIN